MTDKDKLVEEVQNWILANRYKHLEDVIRYAIEAGRQEVIDKIEKIKYDNVHVDVGGILSKDDYSVIVIKKKDWKALKGGKE